MSSVGTGGIRVRRNELRNGLAMRSYNVAEALTDATKELREFAVGIGGRDSLFHSNSESSDITYYMPGWHSTRRLSRIRKMGTSLKVAGGQKCDGLCR